MNKEEFFEVVSQAASRRGEALEKQDTKRANIEAEKIANLIKENLNQLTIEDCKKHLVHHDPYARIIFSRILLLKDPNNKDAIDVLEKITHKEGGGYPAAEAHMGLFLRE
jgi:hypothetical protein